MQKVEDIRNIAFCGHGSAGKTTLVDAMLNKSGAVNRQASVDDGTSICDFDEEEKQHKYSVEASVCHFAHGGKQFHVIDTPGYPDFIGQTIGALRGVDTAAIVINAQAGIEVNTRRVFQEAANAGLGRMIIVSKMDSENIDFPTLIDAIKELFGSACVLLNVPLGSGANFRGVASTLFPPDDASDALLDPTEIHEPLIESIVENDEQAMERYFEGVQPSDEELSRLVVEAVAGGSLIPIVCVSAKTGGGIDELLDAMAMCGLPPGVVDRTARSADGEPVAVKACADGPLVAQVFKTRIDPFVQKISYIRIYSGTLKKDQTVAASSARKGVKISQLFRVQASETEPIDAGGPGEIVAVTKVDELETGTSLGDLIMPAIAFPTPMVGLAVTPKSRGDEAKLSGSLHKIVDEDSSFRLDRDPQTKELVMTGMSELHLQIVRERLKRRDKVEIETKEPKIPYRETIQSPAEGSYRHKKQTGGRGQFGEVHIRLFPLPNGVDPAEYCTKSRFATIRDYQHDEAINFIFVDSVVGATIPGNFMPAVLKGFRERMTKGVVAGYQVVNVAAEVHFGKHHPVDSSETAFKMAGSMCFREVFQKAKPALLEPIVKIQVTVPSNNVGDVNSDLSTRRGRPLGMESAGGDLQTIVAEVPLAEVTTYARSLSSITGGQGSYTLEFSHYDIVPGDVQKKIMAQATLKDEDD